MDKRLNIEQLILERLSGGISEEEDRYLQQQIESSEEVKKKWITIKDTFEKDELHKSYFLAVNKDAAWKNVKQNIEFKKRKRALRKKRMVAAASLLLPLILASIFYTRYRAPHANKTNQPPENAVRLYIKGSTPVNLSQYEDSAKLLASGNVNLKVSNGVLSYFSLKNQEVSHQLNTLLIPPTKTYKIILSDGTEVTLNSMSKLQFPFTFPGDKREVYINGEAYFKVARDEERPFIVHTASTEIQVLGTEFNVNTYDSLQVRTSLVSGAISTQAAGEKAVELKPGYEALFTPNNGFHIQSFDKNGTLSWMRGVYYFQNATLQDIAASIYRWYGDSIVFDTPETGSIRFTGAMIKNAPLKELLDNLSLTSNLAYSIRGETVHLSHR